MGHRTLSLGLIIRALFMDSAAFDELRDDDNPFIEGLFLIVLLGIATALLALVGDVLEWASMPSITAIRDALWGTVQQQPWWAQVSGAPQALESFKRVWETAWSIVPGLFGAANPGTAALNIVLWPLGLALSWIVFGTLAHLAANALGGTGTYSQTLGATALSFTPWLLRGLGIIPFLVVGAVISTWQLILRFKAVRSAHRMTWQRAAVATMLPFAVYAVFWIVLSAGIAVLVALAVGR